VKLTSVLAIIFATEIGYAQQSKTFNFDSEAAGKAPAGFTSYATGGGPAGKWVVTEMKDARVAHMDQGGQRDRVRRSDGIIAMKGLKQ